MALQELESTEALLGFCTTHRNALICFSATWCGPCSASKPALQDLAAKYQQDVTKDVHFGIVYEHNLGEDIHSYRVRAFPTYVLFQNQREASRIEGVNLEGIRTMIESAGCQADLTGGYSLGGSNTAAVPLTAAEARMQRLARLGGPSPTPSAPPEEKAPPAPQPDALPEPATQDVEMTDVDDDDKPPAAAVDPTANLNQETLQSLTESMGFSLLRAQKGLLYGNGGTLEGAVEWIMEHQDDDDVDDPIPTQPVLKAQSYKCNDCGKILTNMANLELHANKTGHADFEESTEQVTPLTDEEKAKKIEEIKSLLKAKRAEREEQEKVDEIEREKQRRFMAKEMTKTKEQLDMEQRKRDAILRKKEKESFKRERDRIRAELAKDKAERIANKGKLSSRLGVDGYNPDGIQYDVDPEGASHQTHQAESEPKKPVVSTVKIDQCIKKVSSYRAGGDGGKCLKVLLAYVGNVVDQPDEEKFKTINMENKAFKTKIKPFIGAKQLLTAVGFEQNEAGDAMILKEDVDVHVLAETKAKLATAYETY